MKMKQIRALAAGLILALALTACGGAQSGQSSNVPAQQNGQQEASQTETPETGTPQNETPANHLEEIKSQGKIVVATSADYPPFEYHALIDGKDKIVGWEMELAEAIAAELGVELQIKEGIFDTLLLDLAAGKADMVISAMTITPDRLESVDFTDPYWMTAQSVLIRGGDAEKIAKAEDLSEKRVGVQLGTTGEVAAKEVEGTEVRSYELFEAAVLDLVSNRLDAVVGDYAVVKNYAASQPGLTVAFELTREENAIAIRKGDDELREALNEILAKLKENGTIDQLIEKYEVAPPPEYKGE